MTPTQPPRVTPCPFGPRPSLAGRNRLRPLVAQPIHGLVIAPHVADRARLDEEPTPICASVEQDLDLSFDELTEPGPRAGRPKLRALEHSSALEDEPAAVADPVITPEPDIEGPTAPGTDDQPDTDPEPESQSESPAESQPEAASVPETQPPGSDGNDKPIAPVPDTDVADEADTSADSSAGDEPEPPASA